jgi:predicted ferric reductase
LGWVSLIKQAVLQHKWLSIAVLILVIAVMLLLAMTGAIKHPQITTDSCEVLGIGPSAMHFKTATNQVYSLGTLPIHEVALQCKRLGVLTFNDPEPLHNHIVTGDKARVEHRRYAFGFNQWRVHVGNNG